MNYIIYHDPTSLLHNFKNNALHCYLVMLRCVSELTPNIQDDKLTVQVSEHKTVVTCILHIMFKQLFSNFSLNVKCRYLNIKNKSDS